MHEAALEELLSRPTPKVVEAMRELEGDLLILGAGGKMGPSLARLARRASDESGVRRRVIAVARYSDPALRNQLEEIGVETIASDLFDASQLARLPDAPNLVFMVGQKFGTTGDEPRTWAINAFLPGVVAARFAGGGTAKRTRMVAFSTGNVYPLWPAASEGPTENDAVGPVGEYAQSALARERVLEFFSSEGMPLVLLRLNYAVEPRYGVLRDIADRVYLGRPVDLSMGRVNLIWQRDANAVALRALARAQVPPLVVNVTGPAYPVRQLAEGFGKRFGKAPRWQREETATALLSNSARMEALFGPLEVGIEEMIERVADWVVQGGRSLGKPTHFEEREGRF